MSERSASRIVVVDDDPAMCEVVCDWLRRRGHESRSFTVPEHALADLRQRPADAVIVDLAMPAMDGLRLCKEIVTLRPATPVLVLTAYGTLDTAVGAMRAGAYDFVAKPVERDVLLLALDRAIEHAALRREVGRLRRATSPARSFGPLVGVSAPMRKLYELVERCADTSATVLVTGESGTGKELVARALHEHGPRASGPFVALSCAAVPEALVDAQLFGWVRGAFTGADRDHTGVFTRADRGTLFLDEIGELPAAAQAKLLRVLQERRVLPVGAEREVPVDVRVIAATHRDLAEEVGAGRFRDDLLYRLDVLSIAVPPLRARGSDILHLAEHFAVEACAAAGKPFRGFGPSVPDALQRYRWPGNVRELKNCIERAVILRCGETIEVEDLPAKLYAAEAAVKLALPDPVDGYPSLEDVERRYVLAVLDALGGNKTEAGRVLGLDRRTIARKLRAWGVERPDD